MRTYAGVFWRRYQELNDWEKTINTIKKGEQKIQRQADIMTALAAKLAKYRNPWNELKLQVGGAVFFVFVCGVGCWLVGWLGGGVTHIRRRLQCCGKTWAWFKSNQNGLRACSAAPERARMHYRKNISNQLKRVLRSYSQYGANKGKAYTEEEDRFIVCKLHELGYGNWDDLKAEIRKSWRFRFDWFFKSRTPQELARRAETLIRLIEKEAEEDAGDGKPKGKGSRAKAAGEDGAAGAAGRKRKADISGGGTPQPEGAAGTSNPAAKRGKK